MTNLLIFLLIIILIGILIYDPKLDKTSEGDVLLWYNYKNKRNYKVIWKQYIKK